MEKDLLDISGEDDEDNWLLKSTPKKVHSGREKSYLNCSPLQIPKPSRIPPTRPPLSSMGRVTGNNKEQPCPSVDTDNIGKENSKVDMPKLSVERQQMKKKKKNAGFNLRKSLAWDRAFSTDEGVLDSSELCRLTGTSCQIGGDRLSAIQEEFKESISASKCNSVSPGLQALEENLFDDLPVNSKKREKKLVSGILPNYASPSKAQASSVQKKVISAQDLRSGSKRSGCPRPPPSSSLKRPANGRTTTSHIRELSLSKVPSTKYNPITVANNMKRTTQSPSKAEKSQPTQLKNSQSSSGSISFSKNTSSTKSKTKSSLASKSSAPKPSLKQSRRNVISKTSEIPSVSNSQHSVVGKSKIGPMTTSDVAMLGHASNIPHSSATIITTSLGQSSSNGIGNSQSAVSRLEKPSGLRLPKPSIGYFSQSDSQPSHSSGDKQSQLPRSDVCPASHFSLIPTFKKPQVAEKVPCVNPKAATGNFGSSGSAAKFSAQTIFHKPSQVKVKVGLNSTQAVESKTLCSSRSQMNENLQHQCAIQGGTTNLVLDDITYCTSDKISTEKCEECQSNSELLPSGSISNVQDGKKSDDSRDEKGNSCCSVEEYCSLPLKDSMDSPLQASPRNELRLDVHERPLNECVHPGNEDQINPCLSGEKDVLIAYHSTENVSKQPRILDSLTADPTLIGDFGSLKGDVDYPSLENQLGNTGLAEAPDRVQSPCNRLVENAESNSILCNPNMVCDGQAVLEMEKRIELSGSTEITGVEENAESNSILCNPNMVCDGQAVLEMEKRIELSDSTEITGVEENAESNSILCNPNMVCDGQAVLEMEKRIELSDSTEITGVEENAESNSILCNPNMVCDGQAVLEMEKRIELSNSTEITGEAGFTGPFSECKDLFREYEKHNLLNQLVLEVKEGGHEIDVLTRNQRADRPDMQIECFTGCSDDDNIEQKKPLKPASVKAGMEIKPLESAHEPFSEKLTSEKQKQYNCSGNENTSDVNHGCVMEQTDQLGTLVDCSLQKDASAAVLSYSELEDNSELEDMDLGTDSNCSDEEFEDDLERTEVDVVTDSELINDLEFSVKGILNQEYHGVEDIHTAPNLCGSTKTLLSESVSSSDSTSGDPECLNQGTNFLRNSEGMSKEDSNYGRIEHNYVVKAKFQTDAEEEFSAQVSGQVLVPHEGEEVKVLKISPNPVAFVSSEEETGTPISMKETFSVKNDMQINEFRDDILTSESNASEGKDKMIIQDSKLEKKPDPIIVKPLNAVPFSDEWLAAIEAAGEEILTLKTGRVGNSPTEKSTPELGPWSPVKKKSNQVVGPFDCTKYTNKGLPPAFD